MLNNCVKLQLIQRDFYDDKVSSVRVDFSLSAGDAVTYIGTISAGNDMDIRVTSPSSDGRGIRIGELSENETLLEAWNEARFYVKGDGDIHFAGDVIAEKGDVIANIDNEGSVLITGSVESKNGDVSVQTGKGEIYIGVENTPNEETIKANNNVTVGTDLGTIYIQGKTSTITGDITMTAGKNAYEQGTGAGNFVIRDDGELNSGGGIILNGRNGDLRVTDAVKATRNLEVTVLDEGNIALERDVNVVGNTTITNTGRGNINGNNIVSGGTTHVALTNGDLFLNLAEGKAVVLRMENNTAASRVNTVKAEASGGAGLDVELTGNFIQIGTIEAKGGNSVLQLSAIGAGNQKLISGEISVGSLRSGNGTHMPSLWANRGNVHVDEGNLAIDDVLAMDKIHLENNLTDLAIFGRTPTRDGEQLYYWNNLGRAYSKMRPFDLYTDGKVRTHRSVLVDAGRYYGKLYGDNLSVVDMKREWLTYLHGQFAFDSTQLTKPGETLRDKVLFGMEAVDADIRSHNASADQLL